MGNFRGIHAELAEVFRKSMFFDVEIQLLIAEPIPCQQQSGKVGLRTAGSKYTIGIFTISVKGTEIPDDFHFNFRCRRSLIP